MTNNCGLSSVKLNKKIYKPDVRNNVGVMQNKSISHMSISDQINVVYSAHKTGYKNIKIYSAYLGELNVDVYDTGNGYAALQTVFSGINNEPDIFVKTLDVQVHSLYPDRYQYDIRYLSQVQPTFINIKKAENNYKTIQELEAKKKMLEVNNKKLDYYDQKRLHSAYIYNNAVDIHFNTCNYLDFLHKYTGRNNVINNNVLISLHNVKKLDNAFWTGEYMVYGNGDNMFYPLGTIDIGGHEAGHGLVQSAAGLKYQGHSGALNESFADVIGVCFEFFMYYKFNNNKDGNTEDDIKGGSDWVIGEDSGKSIKHLRNMKDPHKATYPQPKEYKGNYWQDPNGKEDYGGVHTNSGVGNHCFYKLSTSVGWEKAFELFWKCLNKLNSNSSYIDFRDKLKEVSCKEKCFIDVKKSLSSVGLTDSAVSDWF